MGSLHVMINGMPGNVATLIADHVTQTQRAVIVPFSFTGPEIYESECRVGNMCFQLIRPENREIAIQEIKKKYSPFISIDFTHPSAVNANADFYCGHGLPFVMGTTGGDRNALDVRVRRSEISAVIAPNMAKQIVGFQAMMAYAAESFPGLFDGYKLHIQESHQKGKADTSGTAKAMVRYFNQLGCSFAEKDIVMVRDPERQVQALGIPVEFLSGHAWHTYTLTSADKSVVFSFTHNVNGRKVYIQGTMDAVIFLDRQVREGSKGQVFTMMDVLKNAPPV